MNKFLHMLLACVALSLWNGASAAVIDGTLQAVDADGDGKPQELKVARVAFAVSAATRLFFDTLVMEPDGDLNGDGFITGFDAELRLFDGRTVLAANDDSPFTYGDGSQHVYDPALGWLFGKAGTYMVSIGLRGYSDIDALQGYQAGRTYGPYYGNRDFGAWRLSVNALSGSVGNVHEIGTPVPEPGTPALFGAALLGAGWLRRRRA
ncbi:DVUA0089 family protein [Massilia jejuensis]|uniref:DVUA0089 family protein n=1 Tax=Massilia jejuensis TaxID=648894 RepID=A0ABW0PQK3_9BURK